MVLVELDVIFVVGLEDGIEPVPVLGPVFAIEVLSAMAITRKLMKSRGTKHSTVDCIRSASVNTSLFNAEQNKYGEGSERF